MERAAVTSAPECEPGAGGDITLRGRLDSDGNRGQNRGIGPHAIQARGNGWVSGTVLNATHLDHTPEKFDLRTTSLPGMSSAL